MENLPEQNEATPKLSRKARRKRAKRKHYRRVTWTFFNTVGEVMVVLVLVELGLWLLKHLP